ncbi:methylmalonyl-CoA mutase family protein [Thermodesulfobacteriota bacterium]
MAETNELEKVAREKKRWEEKFRVKESPGIKTDMDIKVKALYTPEDTTNINYLRDIGFPGEYPFTRGPYPEMSRHKPWRFAILSGYGDCEDTNKRWKFLLDGGQRSYTFPPDLPTQAGLDSDDPMAEVEVGKVGLALDTLEDFEILFSDLPLDVPFSPNSEAVAPMLLALFIAIAEKRGVDPAALTGSVANDPLTHSVTKGYFMFPLKEATHLACDLFEFCIRNMPNYYATNIKMGQLPECGADTDQEIGYGFAFTMTYIDELLSRGLDIDQIGPKISFFISCGPHIFEEVAKFRAARRLWAKIMKEKYGAKDPKSMVLRFTAYNTGSWLHPEWAELNLVRAAFAGLAGVLGGCQGMLLPAWDEPFAIPTERSHSLALGTQQIIAEESYVTKTVDPLGGSYYVEALTSQLEEKMTQRIEEIEKYGGSIKALEDGFVQRRILPGFYRKHNEIETGERVVVRKNKYQIPEEPRETELHEANPESARRQIERLKKTKSDRNKEMAEACMAKIVKAAKEKENVMPYLIEAAEAYVSIGEMVACLKEIYGVWEEPLVA